MTEIDLKETLNLNFIFNFFMKSITLVKNIIKIIEIVNKNKIDLAHIHSAGGLSFYENAIYMILLKKFRISTILHVHSTVLDEDYINGNFAIKKIIKKIFSSYDSIVVLSPSWKEKYKNLMSLPEEKIFIVTNAGNIDNSNITFSSECKDVLKLPNNKKIIFSFGSLIKRKGYEDLIDAFKIMKQTRADFKGYIGGKGELKEELEQKIIENKLSDNVELIGFIDEKKIPLWLVCCDIFVIPSIKEGFPLVQIEAMQHGAPIVATINGGSEDIIISNDYGILCDAKNPISLANSILYALNKNWNKNKIQEYACQFNWDRTYYEMNQVYEITKNKSIQKLET